MIFEITQDYQILVPLMVANMLSFVISRRYQPVPVYHALLQQDGIHLPSPTTQLASSSRTARQVMRADVPLLQPWIPVEEARQWLVEHEAPACLVGTRERLEGVATREQLDEWRASGRAGEPVASLVDDSFVHTHVDHPIDIVLERLAHSGGILPVVSRTDARRVEGVITAESILARDSRPARTPRSA